MNGQNGPVTGRALWKIMRIALVTETFPPEVNGVARTLRQLAQGLVSRGHDLQLVRPRQDEDQESAARWRQLLTPGVPIPFYPGLRFGLPSYIRLMRSWRETRPDVVHIATEGPLGLAALWAAARLGVPVMSSFHTNFHQYGKHYGYGMRLAIGGLRWFHNRTRRTLVPSPDVRDMLSADGFERLDLLGRGVDGELFHPSRRSTELRARWGAKDQTPVALYVGRLAEEKNPELCIRAFEAFRRARPDALTVVVGDGPAGPAMRSKDPTTLFCGMRREEDLATHYASADVLISPSLTETFGNVVLEAMSSGLPVLSFDYAAGRRLVHSGDNGILVPFGETGKFIEKAAELATMGTDRLREMGKMARITAEEQSWDGIVGRFEAILNEVRSEEARHPSH